MDHEIQELEKERLSILLKLEGCRFDNTKLFQRLVDIEQEIKELKG